MSGTATFKGVSILSPHMQKMVSAASTVLSAASELSGPTSSANRNTGRGQHEGPSGFIWVQFLKPSQSIAP